MHQRDFGRVSSTVNSRVTQHAPTQHAPTQHAPGYHWHYVSPGLEGGEGSPWFDSAVLGRERRDVRAPASGRQPGPSNQAVARPRRALITNAWCPASPQMPAIPCPLRSTRPPPPPAPTALALGFPGHIIVLSLRPLARRRCRGVSCGWDCCCCRMTPARSRRSRRLQRLG